MNHFSDGLITFLKNAATRLEAFQVQSALGQAELRDKLEELKKESRDKILEFKSGLNEMAENNKEIRDRIKARIEHLEVQLALGKAEAMEEIEAQKKKLQELYREIREMLDQTV